MRYYVDVFALAEEIITKISEADDEYYTVTVVANSDACADLIRELLGVCFIEDINASIESVNVDRDEYGPYLLTIDSDFEIFVEKGISEDGVYLGFDDDVTYISQEFYSDYIGKGIVNKAISFDFGEEPKKVELIKNNDGKVCGFRIDDDSDDKCIHIMYCSCEPQDPEVLGNICGELFELFYY